MAKSRVIRVSSFFMALTLVFAMISPASYALTPRQFGAWVASALTALQIVSQSTVGPALQQNLDVIDYLSGPFKIESDVKIDIPYVWQDSEIEEYMRQSTISFDGDDVVIDGKHYQDVWLSNEASEKFRVNAWDVINAFRISSNSSGTYVESAGTVSGVPVFRYNNAIVSQNYQIKYPAIPESGSSYLGPFRIGDYYITSRVTPRAGIYNDRSLSAVLTPTPSFSDLGSQYVPYETIHIINYNGQYRWVNTNNSRFGTAGVYNSTPIDFDWVSGTVPADETLDPDEGLHLYVPTDPTEWEDQPEVQQVINNYNIYLNANPDILPDVDLDLDTPDLLDKIGDIMEILGPIINLLKPTFGPQEDTPTPPEPGEGTIANEPWESLRRALQDIKEQIQIGNTIQNTIKAGQDIIAQLISPINTTLQSISESIGNIIDKIETGSIDFFHDTIRSIREPFSRWFGLLAQNLGIWHYVVEWLQNIAAPFSWFWNVFSSVNPILISPVYAMFAATLVIAIYRRFGR